jgi:outer membrane protein
MKQDLTNTTLKMTLHMLTKAFIICILSINASGQEIKTENYIPSTNDSLTLNQLISKIIQNYPSIKEAEEALNAADAKIGLAKAGYLPYVDVSGSYSRIGPIPGIDLSNVFSGIYNTFSSQFLKDPNAPPFNMKGGKIDMVPANNYSASLNYNQTIFDFGKTKKDIDVASENKHLVQMTIEQIKQKMSMTATATFYILLYIQESIKIKDEELKNLQSHLDYVQKKKESGSATQYEILTTQVRISNVESQKIDLETNWKVQLSIINSLLGQSEKTELHVKKELATKVPEVDNDSLVSYAISHRDEMKIVEEKSTVAELQYKLTKSQTNPTINLFGTAGEKNGYFPDLNKMNFNYAAGVSLRIPIFDATHKRNNLLLAKSNIQNYGYETEITRRNITNEVVESEANVLASQHKINQFKLQLDLAEKALSLAEINFKAGVITNLDMLDATTTVAESRLSLLKANIDYIASIYKLKTALGERLY